MKVPLASVEAIETAGHRTHPQDSGAIDEKRHDAVITYAGFVFRIVSVVRKNARLGIDSIEPTPVGPHPDGSVRIIVECRDDIRAELRFTVRVPLVEGECFGDGVPLAETRIGTHPQHATPILVDGDDPVVSEASRFGGTVSVSLEALGRRLPFIESGVGSHPQDAFAVLADSADPIRAQARWVGR